MKTTTYNVIDSLIFANPILWDRVCSISGNYFRGLVAGGDARWSANEMTYTGILRNLLSEIFDGNAPVKYTYAECVYFAWMNNYRFTEQLSPQVSE